MLCYSAALLRNTSLVFLSEVNFLSLLYYIYIKENTRDMQLERCGKVKDLGVIIDSKLTFEDHITEQKSLANANVKRATAVHV